MKFVTVNYITVNIWVCNFNQIKISMFWNNQTVEYFPKQLYLIAACRMEA